MNLCCPDSSKSCAACCGLYNVHDGRREVLYKALLNRTQTLKNVPRTADSLLGYADRVNIDSGIVALEEMIYVCEFTGFVDESYSKVGCMLHPVAPLNNGTDFRGLCHYGSMACKAFFCPASTELDVREYRIVKALISDWHLYGLVATDINYVSSVLGLADLILGKELEVETVLKQGPAGMLVKVLGWKNSWPFGEGSTKRRSGYYLKREATGLEEGLLIRSVIESLCFTFDISEVSGQSEQFTRSGIQDFVKAYNEAMF